jgi:hypothetical protein
MGSNGGHRRNRRWKSYPNYANIMLIMELTKQPLTLMEKCVIFQGEVGDPGRIRTCDPQIRNLMLYPTELRGLEAGAGPRRLS